MSDDTSMDNFAFENFPRQPLPENVGRRELLSALLNRMEVQAHRNAGRTVLSLADLGTCPDEQLGALVPKMVKDAQISVKEGYVIGKPPDRDQSYQLFPVQSPALSAFNQMNGSNDLTTIGLRVSAENGWLVERGFAYVRGLFLALVVAGLCLPRDA